MPTDGRASIAVLKYSAIHSFVPVNTDKFIKDVRLAGGASNSSGRIEVFFNGEWGTICFQGWNLIDANVVCRQLGYSTAITTYRNETFEDRSGFTWLTDVQCKGNETLLSECKYGKNLQSDCTQQRVVGVFCGGKRIDDILKVPSYFDK